MVHSRPQYMTIQLLHILAFGAVNLFNCNYSGGCVVALPCFFFFWSSTVASFPYFFGCILGYFLLTLVVFHFRSSL